MSIESSSGMSNLLPFNHTPIDNGREAIDTDEEEPTFTKPTNLEFSRVIDRLIELQGPPVQGLTHFLCTADASIASSPPWPTDALPSRSPSPRLFLGKVEEVHPNLVLTTSRTHIR